MQPSHLAAPCPAACNPPKSALQDSDKRGARIGVQAGGVKKPVTSPHGPRDSGKGVRIQGGKVYDSASGVTCHWCRRETERKKCCQLSGRHYLSIQHRSLASA